VSCFSTQEEEEGEESELDDEESLIVYTDVEGRA